MNAVSLEKFGAIGNWPISPLEGEMPGRAEGGALRQPLSPPSVAFGDISPSRGEITAVAIAAERDSDIAAREALLDRAMGPGRKRKSSEQLRRGRRPSEGLAFSAKDAAGRLVGTVRLWDVAFDLSPLEGEMSARPTEGVASEGTAVLASGASEVTPPPARGRTLPSRGRESRALLLGPLAVDPAVKSAGIGSALMRHAIAEARRLGHKAILLVGDAEYYARFGFTAEKTGGLAMPGPYERERFVALELVEGVLHGATGVLRPVGRKADVSPTRRAA